MQLLRRSIVYVIFLALISGLIIPYNAISFAQPQIFSPFDETVSPNMATEKIVGEKLATSKIVSPIIQKDDQISPQQSAKIDSGKLGMVQIPFIENQGQTDNKVRFYASTFAGTVFVTNDGLTYSLTKGDQKQILKNPTNSVMREAIKERFLSLQNIQPTGVEKSSSQINYFVGSKDSWKSNIPTYDIVALGQVWLHINVELRAYGHNIEKVFKISPGASVENIKLAFDGIKKLSLDKDEAS